MEKHVFLFACLMLLSCVIVTTSCVRFTEKHDSSGTIPEITVQECFFVENPAGDWAKAIPENAKKFNFSFGSPLDLDQAAGKTGKCKDECAVYVVFNSTDKGTLGFGAGADWWFEAFINGKLCCSTMAAGNVSPKISVHNNPFTVPVKKGRNLLAIKVRRGSAGWKLTCGPVEYKPYTGKIPWEKGPAPEAVERSGESYRLIVFGDLHFDADFKVYHSDYRNPDANLVRELARNASMWKEREPRMLNAAASQVTPDTLAVIQTGDLVQGDCGNPEVHSKMLLDMFGLLKKRFPGIPVLTVTGNHDIRGTGAEQAYRDTMPSRLSGELKQKITKTTFYTTIGGDLFLFIDFNDPDMDVILEAMKQKTRYKFVITHGPVLPATAGGMFYRWFLYGDNDPMRRITHQIFMRDDVIVLTGHNHTLELTECVTREGRITQLMANSVWAADELAQFKTLYSQPSEYGQEMTKSDAQKLFGEYRNVITRYWKAQGAGYFILDVTPSGVTAKYYGGDSVKPSKEIKLR